MASVGSCLLRDRRRRNLTLAVLLAAAPIAAAAQGLTVAVGDTSLDIALSQLARQTGADIISTEPNLSRIRVRRVSGHMAVPVALDRLLEGSGYRALAIDGHSFRVVRAAPAVQLRPPKPKRVRAAPPPPATVASGDVIVTASKQGSTLLRFPGSVVIAGGLRERSPADLSPDLDDVARLTPVLQNTELGEGRNKIFIRGVADSSFNGATQSTASIYFGEVQLGYSGPEPSLNLHDVDRVEVLEGPQGTLYGAGAIGGIIRITPNPVDLTSVHAAAAGGATFTIGAKPGFDLDGMVNVPIVADRIGLRAVAYRAHDGGYIDDPMRHLGDVNASDTVGGRLALRVDPGDGWSIDTGGLIQRIDAADAQYAEVASGPLARMSQLAQPFHNEIALGRVVVAKTWDNGLNLVSATGIVGIHASDTFDQSRLPGVVGLSLYNNTEANTLLTHETRFFRSLPNGISWVAGIAALHDRDAQSRTQGPPGARDDILGVSNETTTVSLFAEATLPVTPRFSVTPGARLTRARTDGEPSAQPRAEDFVRGRTTKRVDPTLAFSWLLGPRLAAFGRFQSGYRTGGLAVARGVGRVADFRSDTIDVAEYGLRMQRRGVTGVSFSTSLSAAHWHDIQADLVNRRGQPYTDNIGDAYIYGLEASADYVPIAGLHATAAMLLTHNRVEGPIAQSSVKANRQLPETPPFAGNVGLAYHWSDGGAGEFRAAATARYVGRSVLGTGDFLDVSQGRYTVIGASGGWKRGKVDLSLTLDNITNRADNRFSLGNPFLLSSRDQTTPLRPFNARAGVAVSW